MTVSRALYQGLAWWPFAHARAAGRDGGMRRIVAFWIALCVLAVALALLEAGLDWSGIPLDFGGYTVGLSIYPPLLVALLAAIWLGPVWGLIPAYLATLASALASGMSPPLAALFAVATPIEVLIVWGSMAILEIHADVSRPRDWVRLLAVAAVASTASSLAGLIWIDAHGLDLLRGRLIWTGWLLGDFLVIGLALPLVLRVAGPRVRAWVDRQFPVPPRHSFSYPRSVVILLGLVVLMSALVFHGVWMMSQSLDVPHLHTVTGDPLVALFREVLWFMGLLVVVAIVTTTAYASALANASERERRVAARDLLTGCLNRRAFYGLFEREADRSKRLGKGLGLIFLDVDHFKGLNDSYGHEMGDEVLRQLVRRVQSVIREHDLLFRWGGEEFVVLLPHTAPADAPGLAERIRAAVAATPLVREEVPVPLDVTVSLGTTGTERFPADPDVLVAAADEACYLAKQRGRNRVEEVLRSHTVLANRGAASA